MTTHNQAAWLSEPHTPLEVLGAEFPANVKQDHLVIKVAAVAINPVDFLEQDYDIFARAYPTILGCDIAGTIFDINVDDAVNAARFKEGDRVMGLANAIGNRNAAEGGFQLYVSCHADLVAKIPDSMSFTDACTLPLALTTSGYGLYGRDYLKAPYPSLKTEETGKSILIWGGSSSVGSAAIQLAAASGLHVITTASKKNHDFCGSLGANAVFDHNAKDVDEQILNMVNNRTLIGVFDAIGKPESRGPIYSILEQLEGGFIASVSALPEGESPPKNVVDKLLTTPWILQADKAAAEKLWREFLPAALEKGIIKPAPPAKVIGKGLEMIQEGINLLKKGVSGQKIVVEIE